MVIDNIREIIRLRLRGMMQNKNAWYKKVIPAEIRHLISKPLESTAVPQTKIPKPYEPGKYPDGINMYGLFRNEIGLSQGAKLYARALEEGGIPHVLLNLDFMDKLPQTDDTFVDRLTKENRYSINVVHINPMEWRYALGLFPQRQFDRHYNIGVWLWELEKIPNEWMPVLDYVNEVWVPSEFIGSAMRKVTDKPVTVIPYGVTAPYDPEIKRADFGLADDDFLVLMMFDSNSYASRKNPGAAIDAFREAYGGNPEHVKLVIKINNPKPEDVAFVEEHIGGTAGYMLITERMDKERLNSLIRLCDVFVSLHRAEGFGLVMAEAMKLGTPCVATDWSANTEFMTEESSCMVDYRLIPVNGAYLSDDGTMVWAEPDVHQAAEYLKKLKEDKHYYQEKAEKGRETIDERLSIKQSAEAIKDRMNSILKQKDHCDGY